MHDLDGGNAFGRKAPAAQALDVETARLTRIAIHQHVGRNILVNGRVRPHHGMHTHTAELVHARLPANNGPVVHMHVPRQPDVAGQYGVTAQLHVVGDVHRGHDPVVIAQSRASAVLYGSRVDRAELADRVAVANFQSSGLAGVFLVLRSAANGIMRIDAVVLPDRCMPFDHAM